MTNGPRGGEHKTVVRPVLFHLGDCVTKTLQEADGVCVYEGGVHQRIEGYRFAVVDRVLDLHEVAADRDPRVA